MCKFLPGAVVPIPTFPPTAMTNLEVLPSTIPKLEKGMLFPVALPPTPVCQV